MNNSFQFNSIYRRRLSEVVKSQFMSNVSKRIHLLQPFINSHKQSWKNDMKLKCNFKSRSVSRRDGKVLIFKHLFSSHMFSFNSDIRARIFSCMTHVKIFKIFYMGIIIYKVLYQMSIYYLKIMTHYFWWRSLKKTCNGSGNWKFNY